MGRKSRDNADVVTQVPSSLTESYSNPYPKYTFYVVLLILILILLYGGLSFMRGGIPVKVR
jgi:hypothetical protein